MMMTTYIGINVDLSQAESRVIDHILYYLTHKPFYQWRANVRPAEFDQHTAMANAIFGFDIDTLSKKERTLHRYLGKKTVHAYQRGMGAETLQGTLLKDDVNKTKSECQALLKGVDVAEPEIKGLCVLPHTQTFLSVASECSARRI